MEPPSASTISYQSTAIACYLGLIVQAIIINLTPILFIPLREQYNLTYSQLGLLVLVNFVTQVFVDLALSGAADKHGFRGLIALGQALAVIGLGLFALVPFFFSNIYLGLILATIIFSAGGGLMEMLLSPIVNSIPTEVKSTAMSILHSFYAWGQVAVVVGTTILLFVLGTQRWALIVALWMVVPMINFMLFLKVPMAPAISEMQRMKVKDFLPKPYFIVAFCAILLGGASEVSMAAWALAFFEKGMALPKIFGDILGVAMFALMLGIGRAIFGKFGAKINLHGVLIGGSFMAILCYIIVVLSPNPIVSVIFCAISGLMVSLLWPGTLVITSEKFPLAGATMFAFMAAGGDIGCSFGPWVISYVTDTVAQATGSVALAASLGLSLEQVGLRAGMLVGVMFPFLCFLCHIWLRNQKKQ